MIDADDLMFRTTAQRENGCRREVELMVGIKLDLEAEVHLRARIRGDIIVRLY
jgi:hypothetical protein